MQATIRIQDYLGHKATQPQSEPSFKTGALNRAFSSLR